MGLSNDAITAAKFDESTAFPLESADSGSTAVARTGTDGDTLKTISDQLDTANEIIYLAKVNYVSNKVTGDDEYTVMWYKNGVPVTGTAATLPLITVWKNNATVSPTVLITEAAMTVSTAAGTTGAFFFAADNTPGKLRMLPHGQALVRAKATIDDFIREDYAVIGHGI